jgi:hypothetical protein
VFGEDIEEKDDVYLPEDVSTKLRAIEKHDMEEDISRKRGREQGKILTRKIYSDRYKISKGKARHGGSRRGNPKVK